jgi:hypothetical protein
MRIYILLLFALCTLLPVKSQIKSGSFQIDGDLNQINVSANADFGKFQADMSVGYNISEEKINYYHAGLQMAPADIYFALEMSRVSHRPVDEVINVYKVKKGHGWGEIAKELGIKPGSPEFHALKNQAIKKSGKSKEAKGNKGGKNNKGQGKGNGKGKHK